MTTMRKLSVRRSIDLEAYPYLYDDEAGSAADAAARTVRDLTSWLQPPAGLALGRRHQRETANGEHDNCYEVRIFYERGHQEAARQYAECAFALLLYASAQRLLNGYRECLRTLGLAIPNLDAA
jgi:hypothetical protein